MPILTEEWESINPSSILAELKDEPNWEFSDEICKGLSPLQDATLKGSLFS